MNLNFVLVARWSQARSLSHSRCLKRLCCIGGGLAALKASGVSWQISRVYGRCNQVQGPVDSPWMIYTPSQMQPSYNSRSLLVAIFLLPVTLVSAALTSIRLFWRALTLALRFTPLVVLYPASLCSQSMTDIWWSLALWTIRHSGPTIIKLGQWAASRRDMFSKAFCDKLSILHTHTEEPKPFYEQDQILRELFGESFIKHKSDICTKIYPLSIGSGCIAHVYRLTIDFDALEFFTGIKVLGLSGPTDIAIKVADKRVEEKIAVDLKIVNFVASFLQTFYPPIRYLDPLGALEQFERVLRRQVDMSAEARALQIFARNFDDKSLRIIFPKVIAFNTRAIAETFEDGVCFETLLEPKHKNFASSEVKHKLALVGARGFLKMLFIDNFVHGDLHPGNILIRLNDAGVHYSPEPKSVITRFLNWFQEKFKLRSTPRLFFSENSEYKDEPSVVLLDAGISIQQTNENIRRLRKMFRFIIENKGYEAGAYFLEFRPEIQCCADREAFCRDIEELVNRARKDSLQYTINVTSLFNDMFLILWRHSVTIDSSFTAIMISMMILEGFARALDPQIDIFVCARPYLLNALF